MYGKLTRTSSSSNPQIHWFVVNFLKVNLFILNVQNSFQCLVHVVPCIITIIIIFTHNWRGMVTNTEKKVEPKQLHPWSRFMVRNSAPPLALFWCHLQSCFCLKKRSETAPPWLMEPFWLQEWSRFFFLKRLFRKKQLQPPRWQHFPKQLQGGVPQFLGV